MCSFFMEICIEKWVLFVGWILISFFFFEILSVAFIVVFGIRINVILILFLYDVRFIKKGCESVYDSKGYIK